MHYRSIHRRCSAKIGVPKNNASFTGKHLCWIFLQKSLILFFKKSLQYRFCLPMKFAKFLNVTVLKNIYKPLRSGVKRNLGFLDPVNLVIKTTWCNYNSQFYRQIDDFKMGERNIFNHNRNLYEDSWTKWLIYIFLKSGNDTLMTFVPFLHVRTWKLFPSYQKFLSK